MISAISGNFIRIAHLPPREIVYQSINQRVEVMLNTGAIEEVKLLLARELDAGLPVMKALGVREIAAFLGKTRLIDNIQITL